MDGSSWQLAYAAGGSCSFNRAKILPTVRRSARCVEYSYIGAQRTGVVPVVGQLTSPNCPSAQELPVMVQNAVSTVPGVGKVDVSVVWDPALGPEPDVGRSARCPQHVVSYLSSRSTTLQGKFNLDSKLARRTAAT